MNHAIFLSGGTGTRTGSDIPKQYTRAGGYMMVTYALKPIIESEYIDDVYIVADDGWMADILSDVAKAGIDVTKIKGHALPGANRQASILNGMREILKSISESGDEEEIGEADTVLVHDAARPYLDTNLINDCYKALPGYDGVMPVVPMKDTVYLSEDGKSVSELLDRSKIYAGQAPELFALKKYYKANTALLPGKIFAINGATEPAVMAGMNIAMIPGNEKNCKVTTANDLEHFRQIKEEMQ